MKKGKKNKIILGIFLGILCITCFALSMIRKYDKNNMETIHSLANTSTAKEKTEVSVEVINNPKIDIMVTQKDSNLNMTNFDADVINRLQDYGLDTSNVKIQTVKRDIISTNATDASVIFNKWGRIGYPGQWSLIQVDGKNTIQNAENTANFTGFYFPDSYEYTDMIIEFDNRTTNADDDVMGCMFRFNLNNNATDSQEKTCTTYVFMLDRHDTSGKGFQNGAYNGLLKITNKPFQSTSVEKLVSIPDVVWTRNTWTHYKIEIKGNNIKIYQDAKLIVNYTDNSATAIKSGSYGFFSFSQAYAQFRDFVVQTTDAKAFKDVLLEPTWREDAKHIVVNVDDTIDNTLTGTNTIGEILSRTLNDDIHFIQWGSNTNKAVIEDFIAKNDNKGLFTQSSNYTNAVDKTAEYIKRLIENEGASQYVIVGEDTNLLVTPESLKVNATSEDFPNGRWMIHHNYTYYANHLGQSVNTEVYTPNLLCSFDKPGEYKIYFDDDLVKTVYAHRRPVADFTININGGTVTTSSNSFDLDSEENIGYGKGIASEKWYYKKATETNWTNGKLTTFNSSEIYLIKLEVTDYQGVTSYTTKYIGTGIPVASFNYGASTITKYQELVVNDTSYDPAGYAITNWKWTLKKGTAVVGTYTGKIPSVKNFNTSNLGTGTYTYSLEVTNSQGNKSEIYSKSFTVIEDTDAPEVIIDPTHCEWKRSQEVSLKFSDADSGFSKWKYAIDTNQEVTNSTKWSSEITESTYGIEINQEGLNYLHIQAYDKAGNVLKRTVGIYKIDRTEPNGSAEIVQPTEDVRTARINFTGIDNESGVKKIILPNGTEIENSTVIYNVIEPGEYVFKVVDMAGNERTIKVPVEIDSSGVEVKYVDQVTGKEIIDKVVINGKVEEEYTTEEKEIEGYELVKSAENAKGKLEIEKITVIYEYRKVSRVIARYIDVNTGREIEKEEKILKEEDKYKTEEKEINGYRLTKRPENVEGVVGREDIEVIYEYKKVSSGVTVKYIDEITNEEIATRGRITGLELDEYVTEKKTIEGYELVEQPENATGKMRVEEIEVVYKYRKISKVIIKHIDANTGVELSKEERILKEREVYQTEEKEIEGYELVKRAENAEGIVEREDIEVIYEYKKISAGVVVRYIDQVTGEEIAEIETKTGLELDEYVTEEKTIGGYELVLVPNNAKGRMKVESIVVTYEYRKVSKITIYHKDANNNELLLTNEILLKEGESYTTAAQELKGYVVVKKPENEYIMMRREDVEVEYEYKKISEGLVVKYIDERNKDVLETKVYTGKENDVIKLESPEISGYTLIARPEENEVILTVEAQERIFYYRKMTRVETIGIDQVTGEEIVKTIKKGKEGDPYKTSAPEIEGYKLVKMAENETGEMGREVIQVVYEYRHYSEGVEVNYIDQETEEIIETVKIEGMEEEKYETIRKEYEKYKYITDSGNVRGNMTREKIVVNYYYERKQGKVNVIYVDEEGEELYKEIITGKIDEEYEVEEKEIKNYRIKEYPNNRKGTIGVEEKEVRYIMEKIPGKVIINIVDEEGKIIKVIEKEGYVGEICQIALPEIKGYRNENEKEIEVEYEEEIKIEIMYKKIVIAPDTSDISLYLYMIVFITSLVAILKMSKVIRQK